MAKVSLRLQLFWSHLTVLFVGVISLVIVGKFSSSLFFLLHLEQLEGTEFDSYAARNQLTQGFEVAWSQGTFWSVVVGATAAVVLSYWAAKRITQPLTRMEQITQRFAAGQMDERVPKSQISELNKLGTSFNRMAVALEDLEQRRQAFITDLNHELRTPLTVIRGYLEELASGGIEPTPEIYQRLAKETARLERLVNGLHELSKAETGYFPINLQKIDLYPLLKSLVEQFSDQLHEEGPTLRLDCPNSLPLVLADIDRVEQVLINLLGNALRYTSKGSITVRAWSEPYRLWIAVVDTGHGISAENVPHVFERFWRSSKSRIRHPGGIGIGLAISRFLVELQGGKIEVESQPDRGSTFRFFLPLA